MIRIQYAITKELPINWTPSLLADVILEAAAYTAATNCGDIDRYVRDLSRMSKFAKPWTNTFQEYLKYLARALFDPTYVRQIARTGPYINSQNTLAIAYRHRPWNNFFRKRGSTPQNLLHSLQRNLEGNPNFKFRRIQRGLLRSVDTSGNYIVTVIRGGVVRSTVLESEYGENGSNYYKSGTANNPIEL